ncbi:2620_t:CDS:2 [Acaulospora morrowiae]|uniref:2620_t:CDS:1 n=1 Tax=Acaulospora morrowiae TaxID=94023 RepID=A0A9N9D915_9GLOM|nr:2620_t:CDS:2 [Acaulospora morrowiae]
MGNCLEKFSDCLPKKRDKGYKLGSDEDEKGHKLGSDDEDSSGTRQQAVSTSAAAEAAERRAQQAQNRGVQKGGGKLSKKLEEQKTSSDQPDLQPSDSNLEATP